MHRITETDTFVASSYNTVEGDKQSQLQINNPLDFITNLELSTIESAVSEIKNTQYQNSCDQNVSKILESLSKNLLEKLKVIIATHESNCLITYFKIPSDHHTFLIAKTESGIMIFDPQAPESTNILSTQWLEGVYEKGPIEYALTNSYTQQHLPQFRILGASTYIDQCEELTRHLTSTPEFALRTKDEDALKSSLWQNSFSVNLYEISQFFLGNTTYEQMFSCHVNRESPISRLRREHIAFLYQKFCN